MDKENKNNEDDLVKNDEKLEKVEPIEHKSDSDQTDNQSDEKNENSKYQNINDSDKIDPEQNEMNPDTEEQKDNTEEKSEEKSENKVENEKNDQEVKKEDFYEKEPFIDPSIYYHRRKKRVLKTVFISILAFVLTVYFGGVIFHTKHFGTMTKINGMDVSGKSVSQVGDMLLDEAKQYVLSVKYKTEEFQIKVGDANSTVELTQDVTSVVRKNSPFLWFVDIFKSYDYSIPYTVVCDRSELSKYMSTCKSMDVSRMEDPVDAKVIMENGEVVVIEDKTGTKLDVEKVYDKVLYAMKNYEPLLDVEDAGCYVEAHITTESDSILQTKKEAEDFLSIEACYDFGDYIYQIPREELTKMAYVSDDGSIQISHNNVITYAYRLNQKFSTSETERVFKTHDGKKILVYGGYYGWVLDPETEGEELYDLICKKKSFTKEPACERRGYTMCEENDIGYNYVEVDLTNQHVYYFKNGKLKWDSDCVTGQTPGHKTPGGLYDITYKKMHALLIGADYETPVTYWMPFNKGIGLHDANWRREFGGDIYTYSGSHGCVNLPVDKAAELFELVEEGMPVVCYWRDEVEEVKE